MSSITILHGGRFISQHIASTCYFDSRHRVIKVKLEGGYIAELVQVLDGDNYRDQMMSFMGPEGQNSILDL